MKIGKSFGVLGRGLSTGNSYNGESDVGKGITLGESPNIMTTAS
jgi:hypothetical protein